MEASQITQTILSYELETATPEQAGELAAALGLHGYKPVLHPERMPTLQSTTWVRTWEGWVTYQQAEAQAGAEFDAAARAAEIEKYNLVVYTGAMSTARPGPSTIRGPVH